MHCSANIGAAGDTALFFGLSGTGKTTLSSDPERAADRRRRARLERSRRLQLRGRLLRQDDQAVGRGRAADLRDHAPLRHGARERRDRPESRARSISTTRRYTENTRAAYPIEFIDNAVPGGQGGHPTNIVMLTADAFGVLPPIARLTPDGGDVPLPVRLHRQGGRHREGRDRAEGDVQHLLRRAVPAAPPERLRRRCSARSIAAHNVARVAGQHRLDRRPVRRRQPHEDRLHARDDSRRAGRRSSTRSPTRGSGVQPRRAGDLSRRARRRCSTRAAPGPTRPPTTRRRRSWRRCSSRTSRRSTGDVDAGGRGRRPARCEPRPSPRAWTYEAGHRARDPRPAADRHEDLLRLQHRVRRARRTRTCARCASGLPGALPVLNRAGGRLRRRGGAGARLRRPRDVDLRAQELLLSGPAEGLPDLAVRAAARDRRTVLVDRRRRRRAPFG